MRKVYFDGLKTNKEFNSHSYISLKNKYFFHSIGKAANSTVKHYLYNEELLGSGLKYKTVHDRLSSPLISPYQLDDTMLEEVLKDDRFLRFTFVRNPFSRLLSCYLDRMQDKNSAPYKEFIRYDDALVIGDDITFTQFIQRICRQTDSEQNNHWRLQYADAMCDKIRYGFIGKQESFSEDMTRLWKQLFNKKPLDESFRENKSPSKTKSNDHLKSYWTDELVEEVKVRYETDFNYFNYSKDPY